MLSSLLARYDNYELGDFAPNHPLVQLRHDLLDIGLNLIIRRDCPCLVKAVVPRWRDRPSILSPYFLTL